MSGVDEKTQSIVVYRSKNGPFESVDQLVEVKRLGDTLAHCNRAVIQITDGGLKPSS